MCSFIIVCLISLSLFSCSSCSQESRKMGIDYVDFPQTFELKAKVVPVDSVMFRYPFRIRVQGEKAIMMDLHGKDIFFHAFSYPGFL